MRLKIRILKIPIDEFETLRLNDQVKKFIRYICLNGIENTQYLKPLLEFSSNQQLDVFTTNYDLCLENLCSKYNKKYVDGFDGEKWAPFSVYSREDHSLAIYKLHGSINWARNEKGRYIKLNAISENIRDPITREEFIPLIMYPGKKLSYNEPVFDLLQLLRIKLRETKYCIVIGYSFKDEHLSRLFKYASEDNKEMVLFLIGPDAYNIYYNEISVHKDEDFPHGFNYHEFIQSEFDTDIPSNFETNTVCLPYKIERIFPRLEDTYLFKLKEYQELTNSSQNSDLDSLLKKVKLCIDIEYLYKINEEFDNVFNNHLFKIQKAIGLLLKLKVLILLHSEDKFRYYIINYFNKVFEILKVENFNFIPNTADNENWRKITLELKTDSETIKLSELMKEIDITEFIQTKRLLTDVDSIINALDRYESQLKAFLDYLNRWNNGIVIKDYLEHHQGKERNELVIHINRFIQSQTEAAHSVLQNTIQKIEKPIIKGNLDRIQEIDTK